MRRIFRSLSFKIFAAVLAALVAGSAVSAFTHSGTSPFTAVTGIVFGPVQHLAAKTANALSALPFSFRSSTKLSEEVAELQSEVDDLRSRLADYETIKKQNEYYRDLLPLSIENPDRKFCEAAIIGRDAANYLSSFTLNRGSNSGIKVQDPVIYGNYLVGLVVSVTPNRCKVNTILNPDVNVSCCDKWTSTYGYMTTTVELATEGRCQMPNLPASTTITENATICTSGVGGVYPADIIIGKIEKVVDATLNISASAIIKPAADFEKLSTVFVITQFDGQGEAE